MNTLPTIVALATAHGTAALHIIRVSGSDAYKIVNEICSKPVKKQKNTIEVNYILDLKKQPIDQVVLVKYVAPNSFTGEDLIEINCHGNMLIVKLILERLLKAGAVLAVGGDFSKRAFLNNKIDINQASAILNLIHANSQYGIKNALFNLKGDLSQKIVRFQKKLFSLLAECELNIDYPDDYGQDDQNLLNNVQESVQIIYDELSNLLNVSQNQKLSNWKIALVGRANAGKSSLLNALLNKERVIVSSVAGTTRDSVEVDHYIDNHLVTFVDTAGIHDSKDQLEQMGINFSKKAIQEADLIIHLIDANELNHQENKVIEKLIANKNHLVVYNKKDLLSGSKTNKNQIFISAKNKEINALLDAIKSNLKLSEINNQTLFGLASLQGIAELKWCVDELGLLLKNLKQKTLTVDLVCEHLNIAFYHLLAILGMNSDFDKINEIFENFCVGK